VPLTQSLFRLRYYSTVGREILYEITVDTNIQFERSDSEYTPIQTASSGRRCGRTR
jgi:hypothetical protein